MRAGAWVDTHCHLFGSSNPAAELLDRAEAAEVGWVVCPGVDAETSREAARIADEFPDIVLATAGLHPHDADRWAAERDAIADLATSAVAVGECGLDFYRDLSPRDVQLTAFADQLALAAELDKPAIVHISSPARGRRPWRSGAAGALGRRARA